MTAWTENQTGPLCSCGELTIVKRLPDGQWVALCLFHTGEAGAYRVLPEREEDSE